jgi:Patatin-like phospholipase
MQKTAEIADQRYTFEHVLADEINTVMRPERADKNQHPDDLIGLAFSGGGIRSATFNLGVLQALSNAKLLNKFDYLSTVSGGGYIGSFLNALLWRAKKAINQSNATNASHQSADFVETVQTKLRTDQQADGKESPEIGFLRQYSNYLTPKIGLSTDALAALSVWFTNTLLNQVVLISFLVALSSIVFCLNNWLLVHVATDLQPVWVGLAIMLFTGLVVLFESKLIVCRWLEKSMFQRLAPIFTWQNTLLLGMLGAIIFSWGLVPIWQASPDAWWTIHFIEQIAPYWVILPGVILLISLTLIASIGLAGRRIFAYNISSFMREWWGRLGGVTLFLAGLWIGVLVCMLYLPSHLSTWLDSKPFESASLSLASVWGALTWLAVHLGNSKSTDGVQINKLKEKASVILPWLVIVSLIVLVSLATHVITEHWFDTQYSSTLGVASVVWLLFSLRVDVNVFSQHYFYRNRLTRAYLGATHMARQPDSFTGFDDADDVDFSECQYRPYHIVNTALNLTSTKNLAWQQRKAASFAFTPLYSGFEFPDKTGAYRPTHQYTDPLHGVKLGSIMAVSGAAASPNMGYHSSAAMAFLLTMFNVRLGRWYGNPALNKTDLFCNLYWQRQSPIMGFFCLLKELLAKAKEDDRYVYLSDGGHFENLGIYELARRRCKLIIAVDVGQDEHDHFEDLGNAIRKCQVDLGVKIDMRVDTVRKDPVTGLSPKHYAVGQITYPPKSGANFETGVLIYIKSSLTGDEPADIQNFKKEAPTFPHHSTVDQFFDEKQFESYRHLGQLAMESTLSELAITQALLQTNTSTQTINRTTAKSKRATSAEVSHSGLASLVSDLSDIARAQIKASEAQNKPLDPTTDRAKLLNAVDEKAKNLLS